MSTDSSQQFRLALAEVRVLVKLGEFGSASSLADSILVRASAPSPENAEPLAGLAALSGHADLAARLIERAAQSAPPGNNGSLIGQAMPQPVRMAAASLFAHAALGNCDSVRAFSPRVERAIGAYIEPSGRQAAWRAVMPPALSLAVPCDSGRALLLAGPVADRLMRMQQAFARHEHASIEKSFQAIRRGRRSDRPGDIALDYTVQEAWLLAAVGDTIEAVRMLDQAFEALPTLGDYVVEFVPQAAAIGRAIALRRDLARVREPAVAESYARKLAALWKTTAPGR